MTNKADVAALAAKAATLRSLLLGPAMLVLPNAWDAASARVFEAAGFPAIATTSGGVSQAIGFADHEQAPAAEMFAAARRITAAVAIPVTVDLEAGYGLEPEEFVSRAIAAGAAGFNLEDTDHRAEKLVDAEVQAARIAAVRAASVAAGVPFVIDARVDPIIRRVGTLEEQIAESIRRGNLYLEAGADCVYPIGLLDEATIEALVRGIRGPINVAKLPGAPPLSRMAELGVRRVSYATSLFTAQMNELKRTAAAIYEEVPGKAGTSGDGRS